MRKLALLVFAAFFLLYLRLMPPALAPYRDTGEMTASAKTLGVSHPPSYPLYIMLGHLAQELPLGNGAYRLTWLSVAAGAAAVAALFAACLPHWGLAASAGVALLLGLNGTFMSVALVPEMYSLWACGAVLLVWLALRARASGRERDWAFFAFVFAVLLGNRLDLLLWAPGLIWLAIPPDANGPSRQAAGLWAFFAFAAFPAFMIAAQSNAPIVLLIVATAYLRCAGGRLGWLGTGLLFGAAGLSVYLYLPVRSAQGPWLDWNHPATSANFIESILRTRYGGTLDLLSKSYKTGELFGPNMAVYGAHLWKNFGPLGLAAVLAGAAVGLRRDVGRWLGLAALYWWAGPVFLYMANMPPNPHALSIVEPHYLLSDTVLIFWAAEGLGALRAWTGAGAIGRHGLAWLAAALFALAPLFDGRWRAADRREHLFSYDFAKNVLRGVPPGGVIVAKKDVQLYALWHYQTVQGWRPDARVVAQGLAGSPWYQADWRRRDPRLFIGALKSQEDWRRFIGVNGPVYAMTDAEVPNQAAEANQRGLVTELAASKAALSPAPETAALWALTYRRGDYTIDGQDFFTSDLIYDTALAAYRTGAQLFGSGSAAAGEEFLKRAWAMHWMLPDCGVFLGFMEYQRQNWPEAKRFYELAIGLYDKTLELTEEYHSLPELKADMRRLSAEARMHLGVVHERLGERDLAERRYQESLALCPLAQVHFNLAVLYWNRDWRRVEEELSEALRLEPGHAEAAKYLAMLKARR